MVGGVMYVILVYDINTEGQGQKILHKTFKICKKFLCHIQNSVFEGELSDSQFLKLKLELSRYVRKDKDSVIVFQSREEKWLKKDFWGLQTDYTSTFL